MFVFAFVVFDRLFLRDPVPDIGANSLFGGRSRVESSVGDVVLSSSYFSSMSAIVSVC